MRIGAGRWKNALLPDPGDGVRPVPARLRTSLFSVLAGRLEGARVLDLCAGIGALGLEALSRGAASVVLVDRDPRAVAALSRWVAGRAAAAEATVVRADAREGGWPPGPYDLVFLDPPFSAWDDPPAAARMLAAAVVAAAPGGVVAVKCPARAELPAPEGSRLLDRRSQGTVSWALVAPVEGSREGQEKGPPRRLP